MLDPGVGEHRRPRQGALGLFEILCSRRFAGNRPRDEDRIGNRGEDGAARPVGDAATVERIGEFRRNIVEECETCEPEGYTAEKRKGNVRILPARATARFVTRLGYVDNANAAAAARGFEGTQA